MKIRLREGNVVDDLLEELKRVETGRETREEVEDHFYILHDIGILVLFYKTENI